jgi:hypothetical protein
LRFVLRRTHVNIPRVIHARNIGAIYPHPLRRKDAKTSNRNQNLRYERTQLTTHLTIDTCYTHPISLHWLEHPSQA